MPALLPHIDPDGLLEYSVVYTDRSLNHMSKRFITVMQGVQALLREVYQCHTSVLVPGGGTFGMEAVARQFAQDKTVLIVRNGWFSFRWSQILEMGRISSQTIVAQARRTHDAPNAPWQPAPIAEVVAQIAEHRPAVVFAPHVETSAGMVLPDDYIHALSDAVHAVGGLLVLDCIASGALWVNMQATGVDVLISAPQKGWSSTPCCAMVCMSERARVAIDATTSSSFAADLKKWLAIAEGYAQGSAAYHATMPTDGIVKLHEAMLETRADGFAACRERQIELGAKMRQVLIAKGYDSVAAEGFQAPGVIVSYTQDPDIKSGKKFAALGIQSAAGVPLSCGEGADFSTFRMGLFGLDKLRNIDRTVATMREALEKIA